ncbi:MAG: hypothetical protein ABSB96_02600 [Gaiellaceae bacterium]
MRHVVRGTCALLAIFAVATSAAGAYKVSPIKTSTGRLDTGFIYVSWGSPEFDAIQFERMQAAGAKFVRINADWSSIAPSGTTMPTDFHPTDPADPLYNWSTLDTLVRAATTAGLQPILSLLFAPVWAQGTASTRPATPGGYKPNAAQFANFATAAATRYSGSFDDLPRVRYWAIWNEPNLKRYLSPQVTGKKAVAYLSYRALLNAGAAAIHNAASGNVVIAGETSPFGGPASTRARPLTFMEKVLCVSEKRVKKVSKKKVTYVWTYKSACTTRVQFDVWSQHPYTEGGPSVKAHFRGDVPLGNMSDMLAVLNTAIRANHVAAGSGARLWVTEFSWDSNPPDPKGVPMQLEARWVSEALYRSWSGGVSLFTWFLVRDQPFTPTSYYQSGLYTISKSNPDDVSLDKAKPALTAFRFPFVAFPRSKTSISVWGRTPESIAGGVQIQRKSGSTWKLVKKLNANRYGIFQAQIPKPAKTTYLRARLADGSDISVPFSLVAPKKVWKGCAFGSGCHQNTPSK